MKKDCNLWCLVPRDGKMRLCVGKVLVLTPQFVKNVPQKNSFLSWLTVNQNAPSVHDWYFQLMLNDCILMVVSGPLFLQSGRNFGSNSVSGCILTS